MCIQCNRYKIEGSGWCSVMCIQCNRYRIEGSGWCSVMCIQCNRYRIEGSGWCSVMCIQCNRYRIKGSGWCSGRISCAITFHPGIVGVNPGPVEGFLLPCLPPAGAGAIWVAKSTQLNDPASREAIHEKRKWQSKNTHYTKRNSWILIGRHYPHRE